MARETITISAVAFLEPQFVTLYFDSNEPTIPYAFGNQRPIAPLSLSDLNLPPNPFNVLATKAVIWPDEEYSPQSPELFDPSPISTPPMNLSTIEGWETPHTTTDDNTFHCEGQPRRVFWLTSSNDTFYSNEPRQIFFTSSPSSTAQPPPRQKRKLSMGMSFPQKRGVSQHTCEVCGQPLPVKKTPCCAGKNSNTNTINQTHNSLLLDDF